MGTFEFDLARIGQGLAFAEAVPRLATALRQRRVVVEAPPGTGKTTIVPAAVAGSAPGRVVVTQPRRVAARAAAARLAELAGVSLGDEVGFSVRGESRVGPRTRVEFCTAGVLLRRLLADPGLEGVSAVVIDEVHERHLDSDLVLAFAHEVAELRDDLTLVAMSATLHSQSFARLLGDGVPAPVVGVESVQHPLTVRWAPPSAPPQNQRGVTPQFLEHVVTTTARAMADAAGDALVFVPGVREIERVVDGLGARGLVALPLHGRLSAREQDAALRPGGRRRVVVATSVAESSLTVPGVRLVVDSGLSREPRVDTGRGMTGLVTVAVSRASAVQRAGRAARLGPGTVVRCYAEEVWTRLADRPRPEVLTADLTAAVLDLACWGSRLGEGLALPDALPRPAAEAAEQRLIELGALDTDGRPTERGRAMARVPADPRLARALLDTHPLIGSRRAAEVVAALSGDERAPRADLHALLAQLRRGGSPAARRWAEESRRLERLVPPVPRTDVDDERAVGLVTAYAYPDRIARRRDEGGGYLLSGGTGADLSRGSSLSQEPWLSVADVARSGGVSGAQIRSAAALDEATALEAGAHLLHESVVATWDGGRVSARRVRRLGAIELASTPVRATPEQARAAVAEGLRRDGLGALDWSDAALALRRRLALLHHHLGEPWPAMDDAALAASAEVWLAPDLDRIASGNGRVDLASALRRLLPWPEAGRLDELTPESIMVPTGTRVRLDYPEDPAQSPVLAVKLQECFGLTETPRLVDGRVPVLFHLLSPARRPLAVTADLASFWANAYAGVRAENRGRYSKHPWPEDPLTAPPQKGVRRAGG
ncbi:ATP-dependent helicase HrpB [Mariniluteicoccus endophyticus]